MSGVRNSDHNTSLSSIVQTPPSCSNFSFHELTSCLQLRHFAETFACQSQTQLSTWLKSSSSLKLSALHKLHCWSDKGGNWEALLGAAAQLAPHLHPPPLHCAARGGMINLNIVLFSWYITENEFEYSSLFMIYHRECFTVLFKRSNGWMASHLEKLVLKLMQCGVGREECCSGIKRPCCRLPPKRRQSFSCFYFFIRHRSGI